MPEKSPEEHEIAGEDNAQEGAAVAEFAPDYGKVAARPRKAKPTFKMTEVGLIPEEWNATTLGATTAIQTGPFGTLLKAYEYAGSNGTPLISVGEIGAGYLEITAHTPLVPESVARRLPQYLLRIGDIVFGRKGAVDRSALIVESSDGYFLGSDGMRVRPSEYWFPKYLAYHVQSKPVQLWLLQHATGTTMPSMNQSILSRVIVAHPPLAEQQAIAAALSDVDALLEALDRLIAKKRDLKQAAMQDLLTGKRRLPGFTGTWETMTFADLADPQIPWSIVGGPFGSSLKSTEYTNDGVRIIQLQNIGDGYFIDDYAIFTTEAKADALLANNIFPGDLLLSKMGDPVARCCLVPPGTCRYLMASDGIRLVVDRKQHDPKFIRDTINFSSFRKQAIAASTGTTRLRIGLNQLRALVLTVPRLEEQAAITAVLSDMNAEIAALESRREKTQALKQGMMQELLTGRIRLVEPRAESAP